ncbi:MAG TPA: SRPBCC family protein [Miltoncostaeaceae bacterium]|nr:SRPBCC family protein [Miltoncostaeaceae bacterium]
MAMTESPRATVTLQGDREILITREFDAPAALVFRAWTDPELVPRWWTARRGTMDVCEIDLRVGGSWRYVMTTLEGGFEVGFHGEYREIVPGERLVHTEVFEGMPDAAALDVITFDERAGRTLVTMLVRHELPEHRDAHIASGMEDGMQDAFDLMEDVARSLREG